VDNSKDLAVLLGSRHPLVLAETGEEERFMERLRAAAVSLDLPVWLWSATTGLARDGHPPQYRTQPALRALDFVAHVEAPGVYVFADAHHALEDPLVVRRLKEVAQAARPGQTLVLTAPAHSVPPELDGLAHRWRLLPPDRTELGRLVDAVGDDLGRRGMPAVPGSAERNALVDALAGLTLREAERLLLAAAEDGSLDAADVAAVRTQKAELLLGDGILELVATDGMTLDSVGGFDSLKQWLGIRDRARDAAAAGLDPPRGMLLTGVPGCGKSFVAKAVAGSWHLPLILLDPARLYGKYVGESEERLASSLAKVEAMAPVVLWIDEIEKGFATGGDGDGGISRRLLGTFLRWMQERPGEVFMVATANDVSALPPELLRKGRFDEVFFVDLPDEESRTEILRLHLAQRRLDPDAFPLDVLAKATDGFSGAEIEQAVVGALYRAFAADAEPGADDLMDEIAGTVPLSVARAEDVARLRSWAEQRAVRA
jgi:MoxR-like ATPase